tara:strand:+ start:79942 stop:81666 length:1725 start_codon:yes stop_codon:yes gene_type:complete
MGNKVCLVEPDPFLAAGNTVSSFIPNFVSGDFDAEKAKLEKAVSGGFNMADILNVSRPLNGIAVKPNTHAFVQVIDANQRVVKVFNQLGFPGSTGQSGEYLGGSYNPKDLIEADAGDAKLSPRSGAVKGKAGKTAKWPWETYKQGVPGNPGAGMDDKGNPASHAWTDWILQQVREVRVEKTQLVETFGDSYLYAFGEKPRVLQFSGLLMNTADYNWRAVFWENWDNFFRATKLVQRNARMYIGWDDILVEGYPIQAMAQEASDSPNALSFSFQFYVTSYNNISMANRVSALQAKKLHRISTTRSMWSSQPVKQAELGNKGWSIMDMALGKGAAGNFFGALKPEVYNSATGKWEYYDVESGTYKDAGSPSTNPFSKLGVRLAKRAADMLTKLPFKLATGRSANLTAFVQAGLAGMALDSFKTVGDVAVEGLEDFMGTKRGEVNAWFGYIGSLADTALSIHNGRWDGTPNSEVGSWGEDMMRAGSLDVIIQRMAYAAVGKIGDSTGRYRDATTLVEITEGSNMKFGAYPGAAVVVNTGDTGPVSSMDLSALGDSETSSGGLEAGDEVKEWFDENFG